MFNNEKFKSVLDQILEKHTEYESIDDLPQDTSVSIESGSETIMDLHIEKHYEEIIVSHYINNNPRRPDPMIKLDYPDFEPYMMEDTMALYEDTESIDEFMKGWRTNLRRQFL